MLDTLTLKNYYAKAHNWERELIRHYDKVLGLTDKEARVIVHLYRNKGSYVNRVIRLLKLKRSTVFAIMERFQQQKVIFAGSSPVTGNKVYKLTDKSITKAYLAAAFKLCICEQLREGAVESEIFN